MNTGSVTHRILLMVFAGAIITPFWVIFRQINASDDVSSFRSSFPSVLIMLDTTKDAYHTKLATIRSTWMKRVQEKHSMHIILVGGNDVEDMSDVIPSKCAAAGQGTPCKRAEMLTEAASYLRSNPGRNLNWVLFIEDNTFLLPDNLQRLISALGPRAAIEDRVWGVTGCGDAKCSGICGGGGFLTNRGTVLKVVDGRDTRSFESLRDEALSYDKQCGHYADLVMTRIFEERRGITVSQYPGGTYVWTFANGDRGLLSSLRSTNPLPWLYDLSATGKFDYIQQKADELRSSKPYID